MTTSGLGERVDRLRAFNRFYTRRIGALQQRVAGSGFNLTESRILWELAEAAAHDAAPCAAELGRRLGLDAGYMSRLLRSLKSRKLLRTRPSPHDARQRLLSLTAGGRRAFAQLDARTQADMTGLLSDLSAPSQARLLQAMQTIEGMLGTGARPNPPAAVAQAAAQFRLRAPVPGDIGWVIERHGALYAQEFGWDWRFEALVARIAADFVERFDAIREACWIAEVEHDDGSKVRQGCVFVVQARDERSGAVDDGVAQLRLLLVEPDALGLGLGAQLVDACTRFARAAGYRRLRLWTQASLLAARALYQRAGYRCIGSEPHDSFGHALVGEIWEMPLDLPPHGGS